MTPSCPGECLIRDSSDGFGTVTPPPGFFRETGHDRGLLPVMFFVSIHRNNITKGNARVKDFLPSSYQRHFPGFFKRPGLQPQQAHSARESGFVPDDPVFASGLEPIRQKCDRAPEGHERSGGQGPVFATHAANIIG
jgi:hypothetical protein